jgi:N-acetylneuraminic acid mutarotase
MERLEDRRLMSIAWATGPALPKPVANAAVVNDAGLIYTLGGGITKVYRLGSSGWTSTVALDAPRVSPGAGVAAGKLYVYGGKAGGVLSSSLYYDPTGDSTDNAPSIPTGRWHLAYASDPNRSLYAFGGQNSSGGALSSAESFDGKKWHALAKLPKPRFGAAAVDDAAGHIYVFGGAATTGAAGATATTYEYTIATNTWKTVANMLTAVSYEAAVLGSDGHIYVLGGITASGATAVVQAYNPATNSWSYDASLPAAVSHEGAATDLLGRIDVIGGLNAAGKATNNVWQSQPLNLPEAGPSFTTVPIVKASADKSYTYQAVATANPPASYSLITGPVGMSINASTGLVTWQPTPSQTGLQAVDIRATNRDGHVDQTFNITTVLESVAPTAPTNVTVLSETTSSVTLGFTPSTDQYGIAGYRVYYTYGHSGRGGGFTTVLLKDQPGPAISITVGGLISGRGYNLMLAGYNSSGLESARVSVPVSVYATPVVYVYPQTTAATAKHQYSFTVYATGTPAPTYSIMNAPSGMMFNAASGMGTWTPTPDQVGTFTITTQATNAAGVSTKSLVINVGADVPALTYWLNPPSGLNYGLVGTPMNIQVADSSVTTSTYSLVSAPTGVSLDKTTGLLQWTPTEAEAGTQTIVVSGTNSYGQTNLSIPVFTYITPAVANITVTNTTLLSPTISWNAPAGSNDSQIAGYTISLQGYNGYSYVPFSFDTKSPATSFQLTGLTKGLYYYSPTITPYDAAGAVGVYASGSVFTYAPNLPVISSTGTPNQIVAGQPLNLTITNSNTTLPVQYSVVSGPTGLSINSSTGFVTWTPTKAQAGNTTAVFSATNSVGSVTETINLDVFPISVPTTPALTAVDTTGFTVSWAAPAINPEDVAGYHIYIAYGVGAGTINETYTVPATQLSYQYTAPVHGSTYVVWITAFDAAGMVGVQTDLLAMYR